MLTAFYPAILILLACVALLWRWLPLTRSSRIDAALVLGVSAMVLGVRFAVGGPAAIDFTAAVLLIAAGFSVGHRLIESGRWPEHALAIALLLVTATGAYLRAYRLDEVIRDHRALQPDVEYYHHHALTSAS